MPYWHAAVYRKCLVEEFARRPDGEQPAGPQPAVSEEGLAALEARGVRVIREG